MIVTLIVSCLAAGPAQDCQPGTTKKEVVGDANYHLMGCMIGSQFVIPGWQMQNPNRKFLKTQCVEEKHLHEALGYNEA